MSDAGVRVVEDARFDAEVLKAEGLSIVDFWAPWCGPCRLLAPILERIAERFGSSVRVRKLNVDDNPETARRYGVRSIPTVLFYRDGEVVETVVGVVPETMLVARIEEHLPLAGEDAPAPASGDPAAA